MKILDKSKRTIQASFESYEIDNLIFRLLKDEGYNFEKEEIELKWDFVKAGSPEYTTSKIKCTAIIIKDLP